MNPGILYSMQTLRPLVEYNFLLKKIALKRSHYNSNPKVKELKKKLRIIIYHLKKFKVKTEIY